MTTKKNASPSPKPSKKEARKVIAWQLEKALPELRMALGEKKFLNRVKKAAKILGEDFALLPAESEVVPVKTAKTVKVTADKTASEAPKKAKTAKKVKAAKKASSPKTSLKEDTAATGTETAE